MNEISLVDALRETLEDRKLSRGERRAVGAMVARQIQSRHQRDLLRAQAFQLAKDELSDPQTLQLIEWLEDVVKALAPVKRPSDDRRNEAHFAPDEDCPHRIITLLNGCRKSADICVFTITDDDVTEAIHNAHLRGAAVRVLSDNDKAFDLGSDIARLRNYGVAVRVDPTPHHMHHKFAIVDGQTLVTGSYNWTRSAASRNYENLVLLQDAPLVARFAGEFEKIWKSCS